MAFMFGPYRVPGSLTAALVGGHMSTVDRARLVIQDVLHRDPARPKQFGKGVMLFEKLYHDRSSGQLVALEVSEASHEEPLVTPLHGYPDDATPYGLRIMSFAGSAEVLAEDGSLIEVVQGCRKCDLPAGLWHTTRIRSLFVALLDFPRGVQFQKAPA